MTTSRRARGRASAPGPHLRHGLARRDTRRIEEHLRSCRVCAAVYLELGEENARLAGVLGPLVLGGAAAAYAGAGTAGLGGAGGLTVLLARLPGRVRDLVVAHVPVAVAASVTAAAAVVTGGTLVGLRGPDPSSSPEATARAAGPGAGSATGPAVARSVDLAVSGSTSPAGVHAVRVVVRLSGLPDRRGATLRISGDVAGADLAPDPRCAPAPGALAVCALTGAGRDLLVPLLRGLPARPATLRLLVRPASGAVERDPRDHVAVVPLPG